MDTIFDYCRRVTKNIGDFIIIYINISYMGHMIILYDVNIVHYSGLIPKAKYHKMSNDS